MVLDESPIPKLTLADDKLSSWCYLVNDILHQVYDEQLIAGKILSVFLTCEAYCWQDIIGNRSEARQRIVARHIGV